ncbi:MAG: IPT/TIG domain-containing protein [Bacteroidetes bacterium]|nr:IPT/TIG domain-containing protein [Bacteroidota bacterium]
MRRKILLALLLLLPAVFFVNRTFSQAPTISSFSPSSGSIGTLVTITGTNLSNPSSFTIGGVSAIAVSNDGTTLVGMMMPGATTGNISITTSAGSITAANNFSVKPTDFPSVQQGDKLIDTTSPTNIGAQGTSVAISADGNKAVVGDFGFNSGLGCVRTYVRNGSAWSIESTLTMSDTARIFSFGWTLAINADGNTLVVSSMSKDNWQNNVFVFNHSSGAWIQEGDKLDISGSSVHHGYPLAISADGNTILSGINGINSGFDVFIRNGNMVKAN